MILIAALLVLPVLGTYLGVDLNIISRLIAGRSKPSSARSFD
jgi:hypothetical protein